MRLSHFELPQEIFVEGIVLYFLAWLSLLWLTMVWKTLLIHDSFHYHWGWQMWILFLTSGKHATKFVFIPRPIDICFLLLRCIRISLRRSRLIVGVNIFHCPLGRSSIKVGAKLCMNWPRPKELIESAHLEDFEPETLKMSKLAPKL